MKVVVAIKEKEVKGRNEGCDNFKRGKGLKIEAKVVVGCRSSQRRRGLENEAKVVVIVKEEGRKKKKERPRLWQQLEKMGLKREGGKGCDDMKGVGEKNNVKVVTNVKKDGG